VNALTEQKEPVAPMYEMTRRDWNTIHRFVALMGVSSPNQREAWIDWLYARFIEAEQK
jgi:hypothetical protein